MSEEELLKYMTITEDKVIFDKVFYENTVINCINNSIKTKYILAEFEKWLEERESSAKINPVISGTIKGVLDKLQELKEGKK